MFFYFADADERAYYLKTMAARKQKQRWKKKRNIRGQDKVTRLEASTYSNVFTEYGAGHGPVLST